MKKVLVVACMLLLGTGLLFEDNAYAQGKPNKNFPPIQKKVDDHHGKLEWTSSVLILNAGRYEYQYSIRNEDRNLCFVNWTTVPYQSVIMGLDSGSSSNDNRHPPRKLPGDFIYNGKDGVGDHKVSGEAYKPDALANHDGNVGMTSTARLAVVIGDKLIPFSVTAVSEEVETPSEDGKSTFALKYDLVLASDLPEKEPQDLQIYHREKDKVQVKKLKLSDDIRLLLNHVEVKWSSIHGTTWEKMAPNQFAYGWVENGDIYLDKTQVKNNDSVKDVWLMKVHTPVSSKIKTRNGTISLRSKETGLVVAEAPLPAYSIDPDSK